MTNPQAFPRLRASPDAAAAAGARSADLHTFDAPGAGHRSLPHTPQAHHMPFSQGPRSIWVTLRRDRQDRIQDILGTGAATAPHSAQALKRHEKISRRRRRTASLIESLSPRDLPKVIRQRARDVGWMIGQRSKPRPLHLSGLADALRTTHLDEDDVVGDALGAAMRSGDMPSAGERSTDFVAIQEIIALRRTVRLLLRLRLEHPEAAVRDNVADILARINGPKKTLKLPIPEPLTAGPSFFFSAQKFVLSASLCLGDEVGDDRDDGYGSSSSDDEPSDGAGGASIAGRGPARARRTGAVAAARATHLMWARRYARWAAEQWPYGAPHLYQLFNPLPQCGSAMVETLGRIFDMHRSSLKETDARYLFAAGAAQVACYPLVCFAETRVMSACIEDDDGDVYEAWLLHGLSAAPAKIQLLAHIGHRLATRPWELSARDVRHFVDECVCQHAEHTFQQHPQTLRLRQRGDSGNVAAASRTAVHRSLSTSVVHNASHAMPPVMNEISRRSVEQSAVRDLLHAIVVMAVAHGLGSFAQASGLVPDIDQPAGSFFPQAGSLMPATAGPGLQYVSPLSAPAAASLADQADGAVSDLAALLQASALSEDDIADDDPHHPRLPLSADALSFHPAAASHCARDPVPDPLSSCDPQFLAYQQMRLQRLSRYSVLPYTGHCGDGLPLPPLAAPSAALGEADESASPSPLEISHRICPLSTAVPPLPPLPAFLDASAAPQRRLFSVSQPQTAARPDLDEDQSCGRPRPVHLSRCEDLRWDAISGHLQTQLGFDDDCLGAEVQAARSLVGRQFPTALSDLAGTVATPTAAAEGHSIGLASSTHRPMSSDLTEAEWAWSQNAMSMPQGAEMATKSYSVTNMLALSHGRQTQSEGSAHANSHSRDLDVRQFHDAIWHFTLSLFHIYEEFYFFSKFGDDNSPDSPRSDMRFSGALSMPVHSPEATTADIAAADSPCADVADDERSDPRRSQSSQQYSKWITEDLKEHIRAVALNPASISAQSAQPAAATGLGLSVEEMLQINLVVSLARRQAEIIHAIRAIREYEAAAGR